MQGDIVGCLIHLPPGGRSFHFSTEVCGLAVVKKHGSCLLYWGFYSVAKLWCARHYNSEGQSISSILFWLVAGFCCLPALNTIRWQCAAARKAVGYSGRVCRFDAITIHRMLEFCMYVYGANLPVGTKTQPIICGSSKLSVVRRRTTEQCLSICT